jgi:predicted phosphodiesterase
MKIKLISDIHLEHSQTYETFPYLGTGDILILAGDILCAKHLTKNGFLNQLYRTFLNDCSNNFRHVLYVLGNHEKYGYNWEGAYNKIKEALPSNISLLENESIAIDNWTFIGFTFWTDFRNCNPLDMIESSTRINDYRSIQIGNNYRKLRPEDTYNFNQKSRTYLKEQLESLKENVFVISHHAPSFRSVPEKFRASKINSAYCNNMDEFIMDHPQIKYWVHGHTHTTQDYNIDQCRVLCNPGGYPGEHTNFNPEFILRI